MRIERLLNWPFQEVVQTYTLRDTLLYALSVGFGADPVSEGELRYTLERNLSVVPSMAVILGHPGPFLSEPEAEVDFRKIVYAEQEVVLHKPLQPAATVRAKERVIRILDKGVGKGVLLGAERQIVDDASGELIAVLTATVMCRGDGGNGAAYGEPAVAHELPQEEAHSRTEMPTLPQAALLYRLNGDMNPLHADPGWARKVGYVRPILHGLCTYGIAVHAMLKTWCDYDATQIRGIRARFSAPVYPGETLAFDSWRDGKSLSFRAWSKERDVKVLDNGCITLR
ncbi:MAG: MaoC/PaaZ C-terminal domain-containing protein [Acidobacteriaceae bacterium]